MQGKRVLAGALALVVASAWLGLLLTQGPSLQVARKVLGSAEPIVFRLSVLPTVVLALAAAVLVLPLILGGTGTMLGVRAGIGMLRACSLVGLAAAASAVLAYGAMVVSTGGGWMGRGPTLDLAVAANLVVLQGVLSWLLSRERGGPAGRRLAMPLALILALTAATTFADRQEPADPYASTLLAIARSIEALKPEYPQLAEFSASAHADVEGLKITYGYRTERPALTGGWTSGVPSPTDGGVWLYIDIHDADSNAQIHTQPVVPRYRLGDKRVMLLLREGPDTKPLEGALVRILREHGAKPAQGAGG